MAYCTQADILLLEMTERELINLTDDDNQDTVGTPMVTACIARADAEIDKYCQSRYAVPFSTVPQLIKGWSATLTAFYLHRERPKSDTLVDRYNKTMHDLKEISKGLLAIFGATESTSSSSLPSSTTENQQQTFTRSKFDDSGNAIGDAGSMETW